MLKLLSSRAPVKIIVLWHCISFCTTVIFLGSARKISWRRKCRSWLNILNHAVILVRRTHTQDGVCVPHTWEGGEVTHRLEWTSRRECSDGVAQGCVCLGFENLQRQRLHSPPGHPVLVVSYPCGDFPSHAMHQWICLGNLLKDIGRPLLGALQASSQG